MPYNRLPDPGGSGLERIAVCYAGPMKLHPTGKFDNYATAYEHIQAVPLARAMPAAELVATLTAELKATLERLSGLKAVLG